MNDRGEEWDADVLELTSVDLNNTKFALSLSLEGLKLSSDNWLR